MGAVLGLVNDSTSHTLIGVAIIAALITAMIALYKAKPEREATISSAANAVASAASTLIEPLQQRIGTLERENGELKQARKKNEGRISTLEQKVNKLLDGGEVAATIAMCLVDRKTGCITGINDQMTGLSGYSEVELIGRRVEMLVPERYRAGHVEFRHAYVRAPRAMATSMMGEKDKGVLMLCEDGREIRVWIGLSPINDQVAAAVISTRHPGAPAIS